MANVRQNLSPTAHLLRNSRLFALPNPLPRPPLGESFGSNVQTGSNTATLPFPTHQAIATTPKSLARGDWGLKRPLPSRSRLVQTSNPVLRVNQLDTIEHVTDFDSAADHVRTRQKFEELGIPMLKGMGAMRETGVPDLVLPGAFDRRSDITSYEGDEGLDEAGLILETVKQSVKLNEEERKKVRQARKAGTSSKDIPQPAFIPYSLPHPDPVRHNMRRWKHDGPWLPGMSADEFSAYITKELSARRSEFNRYLVQYVKNSIYTMRQQAASQSESMPLDAQEAEAVLVEQEKQWANISQEDIDEGIRALRKEAAVDPLRSRLVQRLILPFLRLPSIKLKNAAYSSDSRKNELDQFRFDDSTAPLSTHPSAGLGYLRTNAYLSNHPILGPQAERKPIQGRVVQPRSTAYSSESFARIGVAGFVTNDSQRDTGGGSSINQHATGAQNVDRIDIETEGGAKVPVHPRYASVSSDGRIHMKIDRASGVEILVARGLVDDTPPTRDNVEQNPLKDLKDIGTTLDENSAQAKRVEQLIAGYGLTGSTGQPS